MNNTIKTTTLIAVGAIGIIGGSLLTSATYAEEVGNPIITKVDEKTAVETKQEETILNINDLKTSLNDYQTNKQNIKMSCDAQITVYNTAIDEVRAKIQSLKDLGIE